MTTTRYVISVEPSWRHRFLLLGGHLLVAALSWEWLPQSYGLGCLLILAVSLGYAWYQASRRRFTLEWVDNSLHWQQQRYELGAGSRVGPGFLWLDLQGAQPCRLWIFVDSLAPQEYRRLARNITLCTEP